MPPFMVFPVTFRQSILAILLVLLSVPAFCAADAYTTAPPNEIPRGISRISDPHGWLGFEERSELENRLGKFWNQTGLNVSILIDSPRNSLESLDAFTKRTAERWGLVGNSERSGGVLMVVDPQMRRASLSVSPELMLDLSSDSIERIINGNVNPMLLQGALAGGISVGFDRIAASLEHSNHLNASVFASGYGVFAAVCFFIAGMLLRRTWGPTMSAIASSLCFGVFVCLDGFTLGFPWYGILFCSTISSIFLGLFVWIGLGNDVIMDDAKR